MSKILIGCDPEVFIKYQQNLVSAIGIVGGSKSRPREIKDGTLQEDNVLAELGIIPAATEDDFVYRVNSVLNQLQEHLRTVDAGLSFSIMASAMMPESQLRDPRAMEFGCEPDYDAWSDGKVNPRPTATSALRTAGGHIHIGYDLDDGPDRMDVIKACDVFMGIPGVLLDGDTERMKLYGKPGAFRPKPYGVEYRTPSNFWLKSDELMRFMYRQAHRAVAAASDTQFMETINAQSLRLSGIICSADRDGAEAVCREFGITVPSAADAISAVSGGNSQAA